MLAALALELVLRLMPVFEPLETQPVNSEAPYMHRRPNNNATYSVGWNFAIVNKVRTNNFGFVNDQDYRAEDDRPLLAIVGDSYIEALVLPYAQTIHGRLARLVGPRGRVYSFGIGGWPLSQYLAYARFLRDTFRPRVMVVVVVGNDFDQSLLEYGPSPGNHYFARGPEGSLELRLLPFDPSAWRRVIASSALLRYVFVNLSLPALIKNVRPRGSDDFVGNVAAKANRSRVERGSEVVDRFLELLPACSGLDSGEVVLLVDGMRPHLYDPAALASAEESFFAVMRRRLIARATTAGYVVIDMQPRFIARHALDGARFEWPMDGHWNKHGHEEAAKAVAETGLFERVFGAADRRTREEQRHRSRPVANDMGCG
jgi:hypothetical protein